MMITTLLLLGSGLLQQTPVCGLTPQRPCYTKPVAEEVKDVHQQFRAADQSVNTINPYTINPYYLTDSAPYFLCDGSEMRAVTACRVALEKERSDANVFVYVIGFMVALGAFVAGLSSALMRFDKIVAAFIRSEMPAQMFARALLYFLAMFGGTALAFGLFR